MPRRNSRHFRDFGFCRCGFSFLSFLSLFLSFSLSLSLSLCLVDRRSDIVDIQYACFSPISFGETVVYRRPPSTKVFAIWSHMSRHYHASRAFRDIIKSRILAELAIYVYHLACHYVTTWRRKAEKFMLGANSPRNFSRTDLGDRPVFCMYRFLVLMWIRAFSPSNSIFYSVCRTKPAECEGVPCSQEA